MTELELRTLLLEVADELDAMLDTFPMAGRHTRARWATAYIRLPTFADRLLSRHAEPH